VQKNKIIIFLTFYFFQSASFQKIDRRSLAQIFFTRKIYRTYLPFGPSTMASSGHFYCLEFFFGNFETQSGLLAESVIIVDSLDPSASKKMFESLMDAQPQFYDVETYDKSRKQIYEELSCIAEKCGVSREKFLQQAALDTSGGQLNSGNSATRILKFYVRQHRQLAVHATPTMRVNGIVLDCSSGWTLEV
jgi:hypothetical protein